MFELYWERYDNKGDFPMGTFSSLEQAKAAIPAAKAELLDQAAGTDTTWLGDEGRWVIIGDKCEEIEEIAWENA